MLQDCAYRRMMDEYYKTERPLTLDRKLLYARVRAYTTEEQWAVDAVLVEFFTETKRGHANKRADEEIRDTNLRAKASQRNGLLGGRPRTKQVILRLKSGTQTESSSDFRLQTSEEPTTKTFHPPTQVEVCAYMQSRGIPDAERQAELFDAHHATRKWRLGGGKGPVMADWKRAVITWQANIGKFDGGRNGARQPTSAGAAGGVTRAEQRLANSRQQAADILGYSGPVVGGLRADLPRRPHADPACFLPGNSEALVIETRNYAPSLVDRGPAITAIPAQSRKDIRDSGDADGAPAADKQPAKVS